MDPTSEQPTTEEVDAESTVRTDMRAPGAPVPARALAATIDDEDTVASAAPAAKKPSVPEAAVTLSVPLARTKTPVDDLKALSDTTPTAVPKPDTLPTMPKAEATPPPSKPDASAAQPKPMKRVHTKKLTPIKVPAVAPPPKKWTKKRQIMVVIGASVVALLIAFVGFIFVEPEKPPAAKPLMAKTGAAAEPSAEKIAAVAASAPDDPPKVPEPPKPAPAEEALADLGAAPADPAQPAAAAAPAPAAPAAPAAAPAK